MAAAAVQANRVDRHKIEMKRVNVNFAEAGGRTELNKRCACVRGDKNHQRRQHMYEQKFEWETIVECGMERSKIEHERMNK